MKLGELEVRVLHESRFWLDGGQMFGLVPRVFWEREAAPDARHRIPLGVHPLLVHSGNTWALLDTGNGNKFDAKFRDIYRVEDDRAVHETLSEQGISPADIGVVVLSHLHFDHAGGAARADGSRILPAFPNARVVIDRGEWHDAWHPSEYTKGGYKPFDFECLESRADWVSPAEDVEVLPGVWFMRSPGHTAHHRTFLLHSEGQSLWYTVDSVPQSHHVRLPWVAGLDHFPLISLQTKRHFLRQAAEAHWWVCFAHQPGPATLGRMVAKDGAWSLAGPLRETID